MTKQQQSHQQCKVFQFFEEHILFTVMIEPKKKPKPVS